MLTTFTSYAIGTLRACPSCGAGYDAPTAVCTACAEAGVCAVCAGDHHTTRCEYIHRALRDPDSSDPAPPPWDEPISGRAIARDWLRSKRHFLMNFDRLDVVKQAQLAQAYADYINLPTLPAWRVLWIWWKAVHGDVHLPPNARDWQHPLDDAHA